MPFKIKHVFAAIALSSVAISASPAAFAEKAAIFTPWSNNVAVGGYDAVSYFNDAPTKGDKAFSTTYMNAEFRFASQENLDLFLASPESYAPQYGGYCAWAVSQGYTAKGNPKNWTIVDDKLYLNYNTKVQKDWEADIPGFIEKADTNWPGVLN